MAWQIGGWSVFTAAFAAALAIVVNAAAAGTRSVGDVVLAVSVAVVLRQAVGTTVFRATQASGSASRLVRPYLWLREYAAAEHQRAFLRHAHPGLSTAAPSRVRRRHNPPPHVTLVRQRWQDRWSERHGKVVMRCDATRSRS